MSRATGSQCREHSSLQHRPHLREVRVQALGNDATESGPGPFSQRRPGSNPQGCRAWKGSWGQCCDCSDLDQCSGDSSKTCAEAAPLWETPPGRPEDCIPQTSPLQQGASRPRDKGLIASQGQQHRGPSFPHPPTSGTGLHSEPGLWVRETHLAPHSPSVPASSLCDESRNREQGRGGKRPWRATADLRSVPLPWNEGDVAQLPGLRRII